jgi:hypothetical protein
LRCLLKFSIRLVEYSDCRIAGGKSMKVSKFGISSRSLINLGLDLG